MSLFGDIPVWLPHGSVDHRPHPARGIIAGDRVKRRKVERRWLAFPRTSPVGVHSPMQPSFLIAIWERR